VIPVGTRRRRDLLYRPETDRRSGEQYRHGELVLNGKPRRLEGPVAGGQIRLQHLCRQIEIIPTVNFI